MHAKGSGAFGTFYGPTILRNILELKFSLKWSKTEMFALVFQQYVGERGAADAERDISWICSKFYTEEGNWDMVGNNTPVFYLRDPL